MKKSKKVLFVVSLVIVVLICIAFTRRSFQNDTFYTIKVGESIVKNGIDMKDHFSWHSLSYTYPHWLYDIIIYKIYNSFDFNGLYIFNIVCFMMIGITFYLVNIRLNRSYFLSLLFSILGMIMLAGYATTRAQLFTYFLFILEIYFIERLLASSKKIYGFMLLGICLLVANFHAAVWPFYFILMLPYFFEKIVYVISRKFKLNFGNSNSIFSRKLIIENSNLKILGIVFIISLFIGMLTPIGDVPYTYFIKIFQGNTMDYIEEHQPLVLIKDAFVIGYIIMMLTCLIFTKVKIKVTDIVMMIGLLFMSFLSIRHISFLAVIGGFYLCRLLCNVGYINGNDVIDFDLPVIGSVIVMATLVVTCYFVYNINFKDDYVDSSVYPVEMVDYMNANLRMDDVKLYNEYNFGSYLIFKDIKVYIDSRSDLYTKPFNGKSDIFDECMNITTNYGRVFNKYHITHILTYKTTYLSQILTASPNYKVIHKEGEFVLFEYLKSGYSEANE